MHAVIGRDRELQRIEAFLERTEEAERVLLIEGEAGVGKTTLWRAGLKEAANRSFEVLAAAPREAEATMSFAGLDDLLAPVVEAILPELPPPQRRALEVALLLADDRSGAVDSRAVSVAFLNALRHVADSTPVLVAVDDIQWLDEASAGVIAFATRRLHDTRAALLLSQRIGESTSPKLEHALTADIASSLTVGPLTSGAIHRLIRERIGVALPRPVLRRIHETSGGNPFYALELARALEGRDISAGAPLALSPTLDDLLRDRIVSLPAETREALLVAACASDPRIAVLSQVLGVDARDALGPAVEAHVISIEEDRVRFAHPLFAEAVLSTTEEKRRRDAHRRLAAAVDELEAHARHLALAAETPDEPVAAALEEAAAHAGGRGASAAAAELSELALRLTATGLPHEVGRRTIQAAGYRFAAGDTGGARALLESAVASETLDELTPEALALLQRMHRLEGDEPRAAEIARQALADPRADDRVRAAAAQGLAFTLYYMRVDLEAALGYAQLAARCAPPDLPLPFHVETLNATGLLEAVLGKPDADATLRAATDLGVDDAVDILNSGTYTRFFAAHWRDEAAATPEVAKELRADALARGQEGSIPRMMALEGILLYLSGRWHEAGEVLEEGYDRALQTGQLSSQAYTLSVRALLRGSQGQEREARSDAAAALMLAGERNLATARIHAIWALGVLELSLDRPAEAANTIAPLRQELIAAGVGEPGSMRFVPDEIEALVALGRDEDAEVMLGWLERQARNLDRPSALAAAERCRGLLSAARGTSDAAFAAFDRALAEHEQGTNPFERARTLLALGAARRRAKQKARAREALGQALSLFDELGARLWSERAQTELAKIGGRTTSRDELTPAERRIAELVAAGRTNKEVASALYLSDRTVEGHLTSIYRKLGVRSRAELARTFS